MVPSNARGYVQGVRGFHPDVRTDAGLQPFPGYDRSTQLSVRPGKRHLERRASAFDNRGAS
jgi:hypothetical protein